MAELKYSYSSNSSILDSLFAYLRYKKIKKFINKDSILIDIGCGYDAYFLKKTARRVKECIGIDYSINNNIDNTGKNLKLIKWDLESKTFPELPSADIVTCLAVLEHLNNPENLVRNMYKILKNSGILLLTVPSWRAKPVLEFLAFKLKVIVPESVKDHKRYFNKDEIVSMCKESGFSEVKHSYFQFGMNNSVLAKK